MESLQQMDHFNFFGMIIDAGYPYKTPQGKYICTLKVVDQTFHHKEGSADMVPPVFATVVIFAKRLEDLPVVSSVGDIIRIHRASMKQYLEQKQFNVNVYYNSSWCLFKLRNDTADEDADMEDGLDQSDGEDRKRDDQEMVAEEDRIAERQEKRKYKPFKFSGKTYNLDVHHERTIIDDLRNWAQNYFAKEYVITKEMYKLLKNLKSEN